MSEKNAPPSSPSPTDRLLHVLFRVLGRAVAFLPTSVSVNLGALLGGIVGRIAPLRKKVVGENLDIAFGKSLAPQERQRIVVAAHKSLFMLAFEVLHLRFGKLEWPLERVTEVAGIEHLEAIECADRRFIPVTAHFGNWEILGACSRRYFEIAALAKPLHNAPMQREVEEMRARHGLQVVWVGREEPTREILRVLRSEKRLNFLIDQDMKIDGIFVDFFGCPASTNAAPALFSLKFGYPLLPVFLVRLGPTRHRLVICPPILPEEAAGATNEEKVLDLTQKATRVVEDMVRLHPGQYFWFHRRWKTTPLAAAKRKRTLERERLKRLREKGAQSGS